MPAMKQNAWLWKHCHKLCHNLHVQLLVVHSSWDSDDSTRIHVQLVVLSRRLPRPSVPNQQVPKTLPSDGRCFRRGDRGEPQCLL